MTAETQIVDSPVEMYALTVGKHGQPPTHRVEGPTIAGVMSKMSELTGIPEIKLDPLAPGFAVQYWPDEAEKYGVDYSMLTKIAAKAKE